jgi:DNA-binding response OmpR family regulator
MILLVEDNELLANNIKTILDMNNFETKIVNSAEEAEKENLSKYDMIILDINLPWKNGFEFLKQLRENNQNIPVLILTSKNTSEDKVEWLELGADDYITKPFDIPEFIARIKAILRRNLGVKTNKILLNWFEIYPDQEKVLKNGAQIWLSSLEFKLLMYFIKNKGKILSRDELYENVWWDFSDHMFSRSIDVYVANLRKKLWQDIIKTKKGSWYYLDAENI